MATDFTAPTTPLQPFTMFVACAGPDIGAMLRAMATPGSPVDFSDDDIDKGWDDVDSTAPDPPAEPAAAAAEPTPEVPRRPKQAAKSKEERAAKAERKAAKQEARRAERKAARMQNQKRPAPRASPTGASLPAKADGAPARRDAERSSKGKSVVAVRTPSVFSHRRGLLVAGVVACLLLLGGLVWFLGWRNGGTLTLQ